MVVTFLGLIQWWWWWLMMDMMMMMMGWNWPFQKDEIDEKFHYSWNIIDGLMMKLTFNWYWWLLMIIIQDWWWWWNWWPNPNIPWFQCAWKLIIERGRMTIEPKPDDWGGVTNAKSMPIDDDDKWTNWWLTNWRKQYYCVKSQQFSDPLVVWPQLMTNWKIGEWSEPLKLRRALMMMKLPDDKLMMKLLMTWWWWYCVSWK